MGKVVFYSICFCSILMSNVIAAEPLKVDCDKQQLSKFKEFINIELLEADDQLNNFYTFHQENLLVLVGSELGSAEHDKAVKEGQELLCLLKFAELVKSKMLSASKSKKQNKKMCSAVVEYCKIVEEKKAPLSLQKFSLDEKISDVNVGDFNCSQQWDLVVTPEKCSAHGL